MKKILVVSVLMIFILAGINSTAIKVSKNNADDTFSNDRNHYALIVGVETYEDPEFNSKMIKYADKIDDGARKMYELINSSRNFEEENIKMLINEEGTKANISDAITSWLDDKESEKDVVLIFITGHAWRMPFSNRSEGHAYYFPYDLSTSRYSENAITDIEIDSWLDNLESKHVVVILDTCFSGRMFALRQFGRTILAAGGKYLFCPVDEDDNLGSGIFTYFLLQSFKGVADLNNDGWVSANEAFRYVRWPVLWFSAWVHFPYFEKHPNYIYFNGPQIPFMYDRHLGDIPLIQY